MRRICTLLRTRQRPLPCSCHARSGRSPIGLGTSCPANPCPAQLASALRANWSAVLLSLRARATSASPIATRASPDRSRSGEERKISKQASAFVPMPRRNHRVDQPRTRTSLPTAALTSEERIRFPASSARCGWPARVQVDRSTRVRLEPVSLHEPGAPMLRQRPVTPLPTRASRVKPQIGGVFAVACPEGQVGCELAGLHPRGPDEVPPMSSRGADRLPPVPGE